MKVILSEAKNPSFVMSLKLDSSLQNDKFELFLDNPNLNFRQLQNFIKYFKMIENFWNESH